MSWTCDAFSSLSGWMIHSASVHSKHALSVAHSHCMSSYRFLRISTHFSLHLIILVGVPGPQTYDNAANGGAVSISVAARRQLISAQVEDVEDGRISRMAVG